MDLLNKIFKNKVDKHWSSFEYFNPKWKDRISEMSRLISEDEKSILDLGCGKMWLKNYIKDDKIYFGCDYILRDENTIVCDFSKSEFPAIYVDVCFASGVLEYVINLPWFLDEISNHCKSFICSYCHKDAESNLNLRKKQGWVNHLTSREFVDLVETKGFRLEEKVEKIKKNDIYKFIK